MPLKNIQKSLFNTLVTLLLVTVNVFFYSFITIALYKLICYDSTSAVTASFFNKESSITLKPLFLQFNNYYYIKDFT